MCRWSLDDHQTKLTGLSAAEIQSLFLARWPRLVADPGLKRGWRDPAESIVSLPV